MTKRKQRVVELNLTAMLDVVFQLIIFFILVTNFAAADLPPLDPPDPQHSRARMLTNTITRLVNIVPDKTRPGYAKYVLIADHEFTLQRVAMVTQLLKEEKQRTPKLEVSLRVDKHLRYDQVQPVMQAITLAGIARVNMVALLSAGEPQNSNP